jgi:hypothetical protein
MLSEDGGVGTVSSSVRRARSSRGDFARGLAFAFGLDVRPAEVRAAALRVEPARAADRFGFAAFVAALPVDRLALVRDALRFLASVPNLLRREAVRLAMMPSFRTLTVCR